MFKEVQYFACRFSCKTAAVTDLKPAKINKNKIKKSELSLKSINLLKIMIY